jgi:WD40-like Beta Propeller Repeat
MKHTRVWLLLCLAHFCASAYAPPPAVTPWAPRGISSPQFESHAAFDPRNGDLYFVRSSPKFEGWRIFVSQCTARGWSDPVPAADGWLYFGSDRPGGLGKTDIWRARADGQDRWTVRNLEPSINSAAHEYESLISPDGSPVGKN